MFQIRLAGCVILKNNNILLLHRIKTDWYELPGGKVEQNENPEDAAIRELKEELLCNVKILRKIGEKGFEQNGKNYHYEWFLAKIINSKPIIGIPEEYDHYRYIPFNEVKTHKLSTNMKNFVKELEEKTFKLL